MTDFFKRVEAERSIATLVKHSYAEGKNGIEAIENKAAKVFAKIVGLKDGITNNERHPRRPSVTPL